MAKFQCKICGKNSESEFCFKHKNRKPLAKTGGLKNSGKKLGRKKKSMEEIEENRKEGEKMWEFFNHLWNRLPSVKRCWACDKIIWGENLSVYWDHLLPKADYPQFKYEEWNMFFNCLDCHTLKGSGFPRPNHLKAIQEAKKKAGINI